MVNNITILYSGGLDSLIMRHMAKKLYPEAYIKCVYYRHGAPSESKEIDLLPEDVEIRNIDWLNDKCTPVPKKSNPLVGPIYIPGRNLVFACLAACQDLPDQIWLGPLIDECNDLATDKNEKFRALTNETIKYVLSPFSDSVELIFPFVEMGMNKVDCVRWALNNGLTKEDILKTVSCSFHDGNLACGKCFQCLKRRLVMLCCGIDAIESYVDPLEHQSGRDIINSIVNKNNIGCITDPDELNMYNMISEVIYK